MSRTDQGSQFTSTSFTQVLKDNGIGISMDGRGRCQDNIFVERLWWTIKHHYLYLHSFPGGSELRQGLSDWISFYNEVTWTRLERQSAGQPEPSPLMKSGAFSKSWMISGSLFLFCFFSQGCALVKRPG
jgi:hypothetical protein